MPVMLEKKITVFRYYYPATKYSFLLCFISSKQGTVIKQGNYWTYPVSKQIYLAKVLTCKR